MSLRSMYHGTNKLTTSSSRVVLPPSILRKPRFTTAEEQERQKKLSLDSLPREKRILNAIGMRELTLTENGLSNLAHALCNDYNGSVARTEFMLLQNRLSNEQMVMTARREAEYSNNYYAPHEVTKRRLQRVKAVEKVFPLYDNDDDAVNKKKSISWDNSKNTVRMIEKVGTIPVGRLYPHVARKQVGSATAATKQYRQQQEQQAYILACPSAPVKNMREQFVSMKDRPYLPPQLFDNVPPSPPRKTKPTPPPVVIVPRVCFAPPRPPVVTPAPATPIVTAPLPPPPVVTPAPATPIVTAPPPPPPPPPPPTAPANNAPTTATQQQQPRRQSAPVVPPLRRSARIAARRPPVLRRSARIAAMPKVCYKE